MDVNYTPKQNKRKFEQQETPDIPEGEGGLKTHTEGSITPPKHEEEMPEPEGAPRHERDNTTNDKLAGAAAPNRIQVRQPNTRKRLKTSRKGRQSSNKV